MGNERILFAHRAIEKETGHEAGRQLLRQLYLQKTGKECPEILVTDRGKPYFAEGTLHFSISHTRHHAFCVLAEHPVGIDAEEVDRTVNLRLAEKILSPAEKIRFEQTLDKQAALLKLWVLKEATAKLSGEGLQGYPNHTDFDPEDHRVQIIDGCYVAILEEDKNAF